MWYLRLGLASISFLLFFNSAQAQSKCTDPVRQTVWQSLDKFIRSEPWDCEATLQKETIDLGKSMAFIIRGFGTPFCGATGNCSTWIVAPAGKRFRILLDAGSVIETIGIAKRNSKRMSGLTFRGRMAINEHYIGTYRFVGSKYQLSNCQLETFSTDGKLSVSKAKRIMCAAAN